MKLQVLKIIIFIFGIGFMFQAIALEELENKNVSQNNKPVINLYPTYRIPKKPESVSKETTLQELSSTNPIQTEKNEKKPGLVFEKTSNPKAKKQDKPQLNSKSEEHVESSVKEQETQKVVSKIKKSTESSLKELPNPFPKSLNIEEFEDNQFSKSEVFQSKNFEAFWKTALKARTFSALSTTEAMAGTEIYGKLKWQITPYLSFHNEALIVGRSGFTQSIYERGDRNNGLHLLESYFDLETDFISLRFGNIKQDFLQAPLLITDKTFPSIIQKISFNEWERVKLNIFLQAAITDNDVESVRRQSQIIEWAPFFLTSSVFLDVEELLESLDVEEKFTLFYIANLSPAIADNSQIYGNSIDLLGSDSRFRFKFFGFYNSIKTQAQFFPEWVFEVGGDVIYNFLAPQAYNQGERLYLSVYHNYHNFMEIKFSGEYFANQSDSSVAHFNSEIYGHNNREGARVVLQSHFYSSALTLGVSWTNSWPINEELSSEGFSSALAFFLQNNYIPI